MASWGYRVYTFELVEGKNIRLAQEIPEHRERLLEVLKLVGKETRIGKPPRGVPVGDQDDIDMGGGTMADDYRNTEPTLTIRGSAYDSDLGVVHANIALGERGLHDYAVNPEDGADRVTVSDRSAETPRRVDFFFASAQFQGLLVTEVVGMKDPLPLLAPWIHRVSLLQRRASLDAIDAKSKHFDSLGKEITKTAARTLVPKTIKIRAERVADPVLLRRILEDIKSMDAEFTQLGENNKVVDKRLIVKVKNKFAQESIVERIMNYGSVNGSSIIKQTLEDLDVDQDGLESANIGLNTVKAHVRGSQGNTTLVPGKMSELFNYRFTEEGCPGNVPYYRTVIDKLTQLKVPAQVALATPDDDKMIEWVDREEASWEPQEILIRE